MRAATTHHIIMNTARGGGENGRNLCFRPLGFHLSCFHQAQIIDQTFFASIQLYSLFHVPLSLSPRGFPFYSLFLSLFVQRRMGRSGWVLVVDICLCATFF